jgi:hypothetical protein
MRKMGMAEIHFFSRITGCRIKNCEHNNDITELGITYISTERNC